MAVAYEKSLRQPPPRRIDIYTQLTILLSGFSQQMGWTFFGFGMLIAAIFLPNSDWKHTFIPGPWEETGGVVVTRDPTTTTINDHAVWKYLHKFTLQGEEYLGKSYSLDYLEPGQKVGVTFNTRWPRYSRITGGMTGAAPKFTAFVLIFPLVGLFMLIPGIRRQAKALDLLRNGEFTRGQLREKVSTGTVYSVNDVQYPEYKYTFDFQYNGAAYQAIAITHITEPLEDETLETILFYPDHPSFNVVYDGISSSPRMDPMGNFIPAPITQAWVFLAPTFSILVITIGFKFLSIFWSNL